MNMQRLAREIRNENGRASTRTLDPELASSWVAGVMMALAFASEALGIHFFRVYLRIHGGAISNSYRDFARSTWVHVDHGSAVDGLDSWTSVKVERAAALKTAYGSAASHRIRVEVRTAHEDEAKSILFKLVDRGPRIVSRLGGMSVVEVSL